jgi:signal transduction histidine kinase
MADRPTKADPSQADRLHHFAHDLRNRLAAIQQVLQQFRGSGSADTEELITFGEQQYFKAMRSTEELLDDLGVERGITITARTPLDLGDLVNKAIAGIAHRLERKQQTVEAALPAGIIVNGDAHWLHELVNALLTNASKFSGPGSVIHVKLEHMGNMAILSIRDHGVGLSPGDLEQLFVRYAWLESRSTNGEAQGRSTLGRARQWTEAHGGQLTAASDGPGKGSLFSLSLPLEMS